MLTGDTKAVTHEIVQARKQLPKEIVGFLNRRG